jgi:hypothetical protein
MADKDLPPRTFGLDTHLLPPSDRNMTGTPRALARMIRDAPTDVLRWHGSARAQDGMDGVAYLTDDDLCSLAFMRTSTTSSWNPMNKSRWCGMSDPITMVVMTSARIGTAERTTADLTPGLPSSTWPGTASRTHLLRVGWSSINFSAAMQ